VRTSELGWLILILVAAFGARLLVPIYIVRSGSMEPTLRKGDRVVIATMFYRFTGPKRGDVVVVTVRSEEAVADPKADPAKRPKALIKRVVAVEGDLVASLPAGQQRVWQGVVPAGSVFVVGDNGRVSLDSRTFGPIESRNVVGRAFWVVWPLPHVGYLSRSPT
jgi:signal peptidase I